MKVPIQRETHGEYVVNFPQSCWLLTAMRAMQLAEEKRRRKRAKRLRAIALRPTPALPKEGPT